MLSTLQLSQLVEPVLCRAQASISIRPDFVDRAAQYVLERLDCDPSTKHDHWSPHTKQVNRWKWIDKQAHEFFKGAPLGVGIEVDGGLSTRFHRISDLLDWPQFAWRTVNAPDVVDCLQYVFPQLDNYTNIACDQPDLAWLRYVPWHEPTAKIVFLGDQKPISKWEDFVRLSIDIQSKLTDETPTLDLILTHSIPEFDENMRAELSDIKQIASMPTFSPRTFIGSLIKPLSDLFSSFTGPEETYVHHLVFRKSTVKERMI